MRRACVLLLLLWLPVLPAVAGTGYKCVDAKGHVSFQDTPCAKGERQTLLRLPNAAPAAPASTATPVPMPTAAATPPTPPRPAIAHVPPPVLYRCTPAAGGAPYLSRTRNPPPYLVPFGILGAVNVPLATEYGAQQGATVGMSAPELMRRPTPGLIGGPYVEVRDSCYPLPPAAACHVLNKRNDANEAALDRTPWDKRTPLLKKRTRLNAELAGCGS